MQTDLVNFIIVDRQMYRQRAGGARNRVKVRQHAPECNLISISQNNKVLK